MSAVADAPLRLFESDLMPKVASVVFNGKEYTLRLQLTAFGDITSQATDFVSLLTGHATPTASADHYRKIVAQCPELQHFNKQLRDHIQVGQEWVRGGSGVGQGWIRGG